MIPVVTALDMRSIDRSAIERFEIPSLDLMETAGAGIAEAMLAHFGRPEGMSVLVVSGRGNNGGDGYVCARHLNEAGVLVIVAGLGSLDELTPDARVNAERWQAGGGVIRWLADDAHVDEFFAAPPDVHVAVDALLGTGSSGEPRGTVAAAVRGLARLGRPIVAVDIPSGIDADTGDVSGLAIDADLTVTLGLPKRGHYLYPARDHVGTLEIVDLGIPNAAVVDSGVADFLVEAEDAAGFLPRWVGDAHKGTRGRLVVVGGSVGLTGAPTLASLAALRAGAGLVTAGVPESLNDIFEVKLTEAMTLPLPEGVGRWMSAAGLPILSTFVENRPAAFVVGPGIGRAGETQELVRGIIARIPGPKVLDADGLHAFNGRAEELKAAAGAGPLVLTPHAGEAARLFGIDVAELAAKRIDIAAEQAEKLGAIVVLKGAPTIIASPEGETFLNPTGGPALATGGTGDVLAGLIGGFLAQGINPLHAAILAVYLQGLSAQLIGERRSRFGLIASDLIEVLPEAMAELAGAGS